MMGYEEHIIKLLQTCLVMTDHKHNKQFALLKIIFISNGIRLVIFLNLEAEKYQRDINAKFVYIHSYVQTYYLHALRNWLCLGT